MSGDSKLVDEDHPVEVTRGTYSVALTTTDDGGYEARCIEVEKAVKRARTEEEAVRGLGEIVGMMLDERREEAVRDGKTVLEMEVEVSSW